MYYLDLTGFDLYREKPQDCNYESFNCTDDSVEEGWVVFAIYTTYDSFDRDDTPCYQVIDFYGDRDAAMTAAKVLYDCERDWDLSHLPESKQPVAFHANGTPVKYKSFSGWGNSLQEIVVKRCKLKDCHDVYRFH